MTNATVGQIAEPAAAEWDQFLAAINGDVLAQSSHWARVKSDTYRAERIALVVDGQIVGGCQFLCRRVGPVTVAYAAGGPVLEDAWGHLANRLVDEICNFGDSLGLSALILHPASSSPDLSEILAARGFSPAPINVSTPATVVVDLQSDEDALLAAMRASRRRNVRKAERAGVRVRRGGRADLETFHRLHVLTARRQGFDPLSIQYLEKQWEVFGPLDLLGIYVAEFEGIALSAATVVQFGDRAVFKLAGMSEDKNASKLRTSEFLHWGAMLDAKARGARYYDFGGFDREAALALERGEELSEEFRSGASQFKLGFGGAAVVLPESAWRVRPRPLHVLQVPAAWGFDRAAFLRRAVARMRKS